MAPCCGEIFGGFGPIGELEIEAGVEKVGGDDAAALEDQFGFRAEKESGDGQEWARGRKSVGHAGGIAQGGHELAIGKGIGRGEVDCSVDVVAVDEELDGAGEIERVDPGDELAAIALLAAEAEADETEQEGECAACNR